MIPIRLRVAVNGSLPCCLRKLLGETLLKKGHPPITPIRNIILLTQNVISSILIFPMPLNTNSISCETLPAVLTLS